MHRLAHYDMLLPHCDMRLPCRRTARLHTQMARPLHYQVGRAPYPRTAILLAPLLHQRSGTSDTRVKHLPLLKPSISGPQRRPAQLRRRLRTSAQPFDHCHRHLVAHPCRPIRAPRATIQRCCSMMAPHRPQPSRVRIRWPSRALIRCAHPFTIALTGTHNTCTSPHLPATWRSRT